MLKSVTDLFGRLYCTVIAELATKVSASRPLAWAIWAAINTAA
jgi:hypothetical protein